MRKILAVTFSFLAVIFIAGCSKEGPQGPLGAAGPQGPAGPGGAAGTANVIFSNWFMANTLTWADSAHADYGTISKSNRAAPGVTTAVMNNGVVLSYYRDATAGLTTMPYIFGSSATAIRQYHSILKTGTLTYFVANLTSGTATGMIPPGEFRYVIIPGGVAGARTSSTANKFTPEQLRAMSYAQIVDLFHIPAKGTNE